MSMNILTPSVSNFFERCLYNFLSTDQQVKSSRLTQDVKNMFSVSILKTGRAYLVHSINLNSTDGVKAK